MTPTGPTPAHTSRELRKKKGTAGRCFLQLIEDFEIDLRMWAQVDEERNMFGAFEAVHGICSDHNL
jgi:hypothetical protein